MRVGKGRGSGALSRKRRYARKLTLYILFITETTCSRAEIVVLHRCGCIINDALVKTDNCARAYIYIILLGNALNCDKRPRGSQRRQVDVDIKEEKKKVKRDYRK